MKRLFFGLLVAGVAFGGSAFTSAKKTITNNFLVQRTAGAYSQSPNGSGICSTVATSLCKYQVTASGLINIPNKTSYTPAEIASYVSAAYLTPVTSEGNKLYSGL